MSLCTASISETSYAPLIAARTTRSGMSFSRPCATGRVSRFHSSVSGFGGSDFQAAIRRTCSCS